MYNIRLISHTFKYYKFGLKNFSFFSTLTDSISDTIIVNTSNTGSNSSSTNKTSTNTQSTTSSTNSLHPDNHTSDITKELRRLEKVGNIANEIDTLHRLITNNVFVYDDRVQKALQDLSLLKHEISDYETLVKAVEIFYRTNDCRMMMAILSHFSKDIPYIPNNILLQLTKYYSRKSPGNNLVELLQSQLYSNILCTIGKVFGEQEEEKDMIEKQKDREEMKKDKEDKEAEERKEMKDNITNNDIESILYCTNIIKDKRLVYNILRSIDISKELGYKDLYNILKLYNILISDGSYRIEGFMGKIATRFNSLLNTTNNTSNSDSNSSSTDKTSTTTQTTSSTSDSNKDIINCYRMLIKIRSHETFDISNISNVVNELCYYNCKDLMLVLKDMYYSSFKVDDSMLMPVIKGVFENITQLTKDDVVLLVRFLEKNKVKLSQDQDELVNFQVMLHTSYYDSSDIHKLLNYYMNRDNKEDIVVVTKLYNHLNNFNDISSIIRISENSSNRGSNSSSTDKTSTTTQTTSSTSHSNNRRNDINTNIYVLSKFILYFKSNESLSDLMVRRYVRSLNRNYLSLNQKVISYSLYVLYKTGYNPVKLLNNLLPILHSNLERHNSVDLTQILLFFNLFRIKYEHFYQVLVDRIQSKVLNHEFNDEQLVIISKCLFNYKKTFTSSLFNSISGRLSFMNISQVCTVFNTYVKSGLNTPLIVNNINELILNNLEKLKYNDVRKLLLPIKRGHVQDNTIIDYIKNNYELEAVDYFDVFDQVPKEHDIEESQVIRCILSLGNKQRSIENDRFARSLFSKIFKIVPKLSETDTISLLNSIQAYGYIKPKVNRILTNRLQKLNSKKLIVEKQIKEDKELEVFKFFRHISKGPPHLDKAKEL